MRRLTVFLLTALGALVISVVALAVPSLTEEDFDKLKGAFGERITVKDDPGNHREFVQLDGETIGVIEFEEDDDGDAGLGPGVPSGGVSSQGTALALGPIDISGPPPFVDVFGTVFDDGTFTATGQGIVAGFPNVTVEMEGTIGFGSSGILEADYTMGAGGELPGGQPITYTIQSRQLVNGDVNCDGVVDGRDAIQLALHLLSLAVSQTDPCPQFGDNLASLWADLLPAIWADPNCDLSVSVPDLNTILEYLAAVPVTQQSGCPLVGAAYQPVP